MSDRLESNRKARDEQKVRYLRRLADGHAERFRAAAGRDAASVANEIHGTINEVIRRDRETDADSPRIRCQRGCSHCCHGPVEIWPQEAALLVKAARAAGIELDRAKLERQAGQTIESWVRQSMTERACTFLGADGACRVYASRPNACRKLLVTSDPVLCDAGKHPPEATERWFSWEAEMVEVAALETFGRGLMPELLLEQLGRSRKSEGESRK